MIACTCTSEDQCDTCAAIEAKFEEILNEPCKYESGPFNLICSFYGADNKQACIEPEECPKVIKWLESQEALAEGPDAMTVAKEG